MLLQHQTNCDYDDVYDWNNFCADNQINVLHYYDYYIAKLGTGHYIAFTECCSFDGGYGDYHEADTLTEVIVYAREHSYTYNSINPPIPPIEVEEKKEYPPIEDEGIVLF